MGSVVHKIFVLLGNSLVVGIRQSGKNCRFTALHRQLAPLALDHIDFFFKG